MTTRRRHGEDGISFEHRGPCRDPHRHRGCPGLWRGEFTTGYTGDGKRTRRKVSGTTKAAVIDKLRDLHTQLDTGISPKAGYTHYTHRQAADDWLAHGLEGRSPPTSCSACSPGSAPKKPAPCTGPTSTWTATPPPARPSRRT